MPFKKKKSTKHPFDKRSVKQKAVGEILSTKSPFDEKFVIETSCRLKVLSTKRLSTNCPVDQMSVDETSVDETIVDETS